LKTGSGGERGLAVEASTAPVEANRESERRLSQHAAKRAAKEGSVFIFAVESQGNDSAETSTQ